MKLVTTLVAVVIFLVVFGFILYKVLTRRKNQNSEAIQNNVETRTGPKITVVNRHISKNNFNVIEY